MANTTEPLSPLNSARRKAYIRLLPLLFICYVIAYVDRVNVSIAKLTMAKDLPYFDNAIIGFGAGLFFIGYFLLEIPGTLIVERWSARKWISRIMISWGIMAAFTACVHYDMPVITDVAKVMLKALVAIFRPIAELKWGWFSGIFASMVDSFQGPNGIYIFQFYAVRFLLGLAEAGFFPGVIVYLTHWFPVRDRAKALAWFMIATPAAQIISPKLTNIMLKIGTEEVVNGVTVKHPELLGLEGWQWVYIGWGIPAVVLGLVVLYFLTDRPAQAKWLNDAEREALEQELAREKAVQKAKGKRMTVLQALSHPKVLLLALAYFCVVTGSYGIEFFMPSILSDWYKLTLSKVTWLVILPPCLALASQLFNGWSSDRTGERRMHVVVPIFIGAAALAVIPSTKGNLYLTVAAFMIAFAGFKAYLPVFWALPNLFLVEAAAAGSIGLINSIGNLGGFLGPTVLGKIQTVTGSYATGLYFLAASMAMSATIVFFLGLGARPSSSANAPNSPPNNPEPTGETK